MCEPCNVHEIGVSQRLEVEAELARLLASKQFRSSKQQSKLLTYLVTRALEDGTEEISEYAIAQDVYGDNAAFDPSKQAKVRTLTWRLRSQLTDYYSRGEVGDPVRIQLNGYAVEFHFAAKTAIDSTGKEKPWFRILRVAIPALIVIFGLFGFYRTVQPRTSATKAGQAWKRRLIASSTSEGQSFRWIAASNRYGQVLLTPKGGKLFALVLDDEKTITVINSRNLEVQQTIHTDAPNRTAFMARDGSSLYVSSSDPVVMVFDTSMGRLRRTISLDAPAFDLAVTPDNRYLFVAQSQAGLKRIDLVSGDRQIISPEACPIHLDLDSSGKRLFVSYECGGSGGSSGHDVVDVYNVEGETVYEYKINGLPMAGGHPLFSWDNSYMLLNSRDACTKKTYDKQGCLAIPSNLLYLFRLDNGQLVSRDLEGSGGNTGAFLPGDQRVLFVGRSIRLWDAARRKTTEQLADVIMSSNWAAVTPDGGRAFVPQNIRKGLLVLDAEPETCAPPTDGLVNAYTGDGGFEDTHGNGAMVNHGAKFAPGRMGQAFQFDGKSNYLWAQNGSSYCPYCKFAWTEAFFVKLNELSSEVSFLDAHPEGGRRRVFVTPQSRLVLENGPSRVVTSSILRAGQWTHIAIVNNRTQSLFYVNGQLAGSLNLPPLSDPAGAGPVFFGATEGKRGFLNGLIDELLVYDRALTMEEIRGLASPCEGRAPGNPHH